MPLTTVRVPWIHKLRLESSIKDFKCGEFYRALLSEFLATFMLLFVSSVINTQDPEQGLPMVSVVRVGLATGLMIATLIWAFSEASGAHVNPAVTAAFLVTRRLSLARGICYPIIQSFAAIMAVALVRIITPKDANPLLGLLLPNPKISVYQAAVMEFFITFNLCFLIISTQDPGRTKESGSRPLAIGLCVTTNILFFGPLSGGSMNPVRCLGPAVITGIYDHQWIYWGPTILGGMTGALLYDLVMSTTASYKRLLKFLFAVNYDPERKAYDRRRHGHHSDDDDDDDDDDSNIPRNEIRIPDRDKSESSVGVPSVRCKSKESLNQDESYLLENINDA